MTEGEARKATKPPARGNEPSPERGAPWTLARNATVAHVLAREASRYGKDFRFDVLDLGIVGRLAEAYENNQPLLSPPRELEFPWTVLFAGNTATCGPILSFDYSSSGLIRETEGGKVYRGADELRHLLNALIADRQALIEARDRFCAALLAADWPGVARLSGARLAARMKGDVYSLMATSGLDLERTRIVAWRDLPGRRGRYRAAEGARLAGFTARLKLGDRGRCWWLELLLVQREAGWLVADFALATSGHQRVLRQRSRFLQFDTELGDLAAHRR